MEKYDIAIIGGGILGTTISYWLSTLYDIKVCVIEKENTVAKHTSSRNTGVVHAPFYLDPKKRKVSAISSLISHDLWEILAKKKNLPWSEVGTIEVAIKEPQHKTLEKYLKWGAENGIPEGQLELLDSKELQKKNQISKLIQVFFVSVMYQLIMEFLQKNSKKNPKKMEQSFYSIIM